MYKNHQSEKTDVYSIITDRIIELLHKGEIPWLKPWHNGQRVSNMVSGKEYRGINVWHLNALGFSSPWFLSEKQCTELGGTLLVPRTQAIPVVFWKWMPYIDKDSGKTKTIPLERYSKVYNLTQTSGIDAKHVPTPKTRPLDFSAIAECESIVSNMPKCPTIALGGNVAAYSPSLDLVKMPSPESFTSCEAYYNCLFHELAHSTGHTSRLARKAITESNSFGDDKYSKEELCAEMTAAFLSEVSGISQKVIENSASYIANWLKALKNDHEMLAKAGAQAQKASDFILNVQWEKPIGE
jgi:antirestriction protein ArdC